MSQISPFTKPPEWIRRVINDPVISQIPIRVRWVGWESDTYTLRQMGWQVFASESFSQHRFEKVVNLAVKDPGDNLMIAGEFAINPRVLFDKSGTEIHKMLYQVGIDMRQFRATDRMHIYSDTASTWAAMNAMEPCDGFANIDCSGVVKDIRELKLFSYKENAKEIYLPPNSVDECLNQILKLQYPERQIVKPGEAVVKPVIQAKIYQLAA